MSLNLWSTTEHALDYLKRADSIPHRVEGESVLLELVPASVRRILDLGSGDGRLARLLKIERAAAEIVAVDFSPAMLAALDKNFHGDRNVSVIAHDLASPLPDVGRFDAVVSSFAIHHLPDERKRSLYIEIFRILLAGGIFCNLEHVSSPTAALHESFLAKLGVTPQDEDPSNQLLALETQLEWLREIGFTDVDCHWKWLELALLAGRKPA